MKRYGKVFIMSLLSIFALAVPVFAREMTPDELGKEAKSQIPKTSYVYVIGEYAFTSEHDFTTQDVMLAARSIDAKDNTGKVADDDIYNEMTIFQLKGKYNDSVELTGWELDDNIVGTSKLEDLPNGKFNVRYIDYNYVKDIYKVTLDLDNGELPEGMESSLNVLEGEKIDQNLITGTNRPTKTGKQFKEWVLVKEGDATEKWDFNNEVIGNMTLKATWYDEVNTDTLLENAKKTINEGTKDNGYYYDVDFENGTLTFNVYDLNKKNSEISNTGLIADIVDIVKKENVVSLTISNGTEEGTVIFDEDDVADGTGADSQAWKQFAYLLCKLTGTACADANQALTNFANITLGDLAKIKDEITLTITLDESKARSQNNNVSEEYKIEFSYEQQATIGKNIPESDVKELEKLKYTPETTYNITKKSDGLYEVTDYITEQKGVEGFGDDASGFYFAYTITLDEGIDVNKAKVKVPIDKEGTKYNETTFDAETKTATILMEVEESEVGDEATAGYRDIIVEVDGVPTKIRIDFKGLELRKNSKSTLEDAKEKTELNTAYSWTAPTDYSVEYEESGDDTTTGKTMKVTGLLPIYDKDDDKLPFEDDCKTDYYIAFAIKTENKKDENKTEVKITDGEETFSWTGENFDEEQAIYILKHLHPDADRTFTIEVDMDGEETKYEPYTITVDWSELKLQVDSKATIELNKASAEDKATMEGWGYSTPAGQNVTLANGMLTGKLVEQTLANGDAFGEANKDGFYFDFTIQPPKDAKINAEDIEITRVKSHTDDIDTDLEGDNVIKKFTSKDLDKNNDLTILYRFPKDTTSCTACAGKETCDGSCCGEGGVCDKVLYYVVDWDGAEGKEFLPVVYSIDYCGVTFERSSIFTVASLDSENKGIFGDDGSWYDEKHGYSVTVEQDHTDAKKYKVKGVLPIFDDESYWNEHHNGTFDTDNNLYYLGLLLKLVDTDNILENATSTINVKFFHDDEEDIHYLKGFDSQFNKSGKLYILKSLCENAKDGSGGTIPDSQKVFTITLDLDGESGNDYTPYTVTIDWSELKLQTESVGNFGNYEVATEANIQADEQAVKDLENYGYNFGTSAGVKIKTELQEETGHNAKQGLEGKIKEQTLKNGFDENNGYFVPIKVEFPGKGDESLSEYSHKWILILNTEKNETKTYTPTPEEYERGWVLVLFKIEEGGKDGTKEISYKIDFDGNEFAFLPQEYTISYDDLTFEAENKITYKYKNKEGKDQTEDAVVYENEIVDLKDLSELNTDYRKFDGWYKDGENISTTEGGFKTEKDDVELTAHWNLNVEKFMEDVIADLKNPDSTYSEDFSGQFELEQKADNKNEITIKVESPNVKLSKLSDTSIPGTIAYILQKGEIKDVTLTVGASTTTFKNEGIAGVSAVGNETSEGSALDAVGKALKEKVIEGAKDTFDKELNSHEAEATLDQLEYNGKSFTIKIGSTDDTVKLVDAEGADIAEKDKTYTFKFDSDFAVVNQHPESNLGAKEIPAAVSKNYDIVYVDGNYTADAEIDITANEDVIIMPVNSTKGDPSTTVQVNDGDNVNYAVDIQKGSGTVTIKDLKITGGKRSELRIEDGATVIVDNIDVSGEIDPATSEETEMNSSIIVKGNLTATNVKNENESYACPTISVVTGYAHPKDPSKPEEEYPDHAVEGNATVTAENMKKNDKYCLVDRKSNTEVHTTKETYYGSFYYNDSKNSQIYYVGIIDPNKKGRPYDYIKVYYYDEYLNLSSLGYEKEKTPAGVEEDKKEEVFDKFTIGNIEIQGNEKAQEVLKNHDTTIISIKYKKKPMSVLNFDQVNGLSTSGNKVSGTISTQNEKGKFVIPVTLTSEKFKEGVSTVEVTDPNGKTEKYTYNSSSENGIATVSTVNTMKLELEAIKTSKITGNKGKVYEITVDVDGKEKDEYQQETYTVDYNSVETLEEKINKAAKATLEAKSFTVKKNNKINGYTEEFTYKYNKELGLTHLKANKDNVEEYTFALKYADVAQDSSKLSVVARKRKDNEEDSGIYLNDWVYVHPQQVGSAIHEVSMLTDVMKDSKTSINAIDKVTLVDGNAHKYTVKLNGDRYTEWVKNNYRLTSKYTSTEWGETVLVDVELDENDQYIKSIKTHQESSSNTFDVAFTDVNETNIEKPTKFLSTEEKQLTDDDIKDFYEKGKAWWDKHIHENAYNQQ